MAAEYFIMAFRDHETLHFKDKSFAKFAYFIFTSSLYTNIMLLLSWLYIFISILEPANSYDRPYEITDFIFQVVFGVEIIV